MSLKSKFLFLCISILTLLGVGCSEGGSGPSSDSQPVIEFTTPANWVRHDDYPVSPGITADIVLKKATATQGFTPNVVFLSSQQSGIAFARVVEYELENLRSNSQISNVVLDSSKAIQVQGKEAYLMQVRYDMNSLPLIAREILVVHSGLDCQIVMTWPVSDAASQMEIQAVESSIILK